VVTAILPVRPLEGTMNVIVVALVTVGARTLLPPSVTAVAPIKFVPVMVTVVPEAPDPGEKPVIVGAADA
jgi:hypothetical protein